MIIKTSKIKKNDNIGSIEMIEYFFVTDEFFLSQFSRSGEIQINQMGKKLSFCRVA